MAAAAGPAGPTAQHRAGMPDAGGSDAAAEAETTRVTMESMMDSNIQLSKQFAAFNEDHDVFIQRCPSASHGELGLAVRELRYAHAQDYDRVRMSRIEERLTQHDLRMNDLESSQGYITGELTTVNENIGNMTTSLTTLRAQGNSFTALPRTRDLLTGMRGFDKLKPYKGAATEWKEWRIKLTNWLSQYSQSYESFIIKLDYSETEPVESEDGMAIKVGESEITLEEKWCSDQLYNLLVQKCEGPALDIILNQNLKGKARGLIAWFRTFREAEGQVSAKRSEITEKVYQSNRKAVAVKEVVSTLEANENEVREYNILTGNKVEDTIMLLNLKKMVP